MTRFLLIVGALGALFLPVGAAAAAEPDFVSIFRKVCIDTVTSVDAQAAAGRQAGFSDVQAPAPQGLEKAVSMTRVVGDQQWLLIAGAMTTPANDEFPVQAGLTCLIGGNSGIDHAGVERWIGFKPYSEKGGVKMFAFEVVDGRRIPLNAEDGKAVTAALGRRGYYLIMLGGSPGQELVVSAFSRSPGKP
ncbi:hypothetical protein GVN21_09430 [Caulobacter sp. SLTY]|uniref:hypothetical protein n=1 Tax=Caulobacter sp. SLTY TaxID=2683262 RepID=UPI0014132C90|nr:hypothetical protein [Caulobacter sp. SLTY]NBB15574.1 hypothetical protein [Caulobacter sp. SLTY]